MTNDLHKTPTIITLSILTLIICYLTTQYCLSEIINFTNYLISRKDNLVDAFLLSFKYIACFYIGTNIFLTCIGRNMYTWNEGSIAKNIIKNEFTKTNIIRCICLFSLFCIAITLSFFNLEPLNEENLKLFSHAFIVIVLISELYWTLFKWTIANKAANCLSQSIDGRRTISERNGKMIMKSYWSTPFSGKGEQGHYYYTCDICDGKWKQSDFECVRDCD